MEGKFEGSIQPEEGGEQNQEKRELPPWFKEFQETREKALSREKKHLPDDLRIGLMEISDNLFSELLSDLSDPDKVLAEKEKEKMIEEASLGMKELKNKNPEFFETGKTIFTLHEILQAYNKFAGRENLERFDIPHHNDMAKSLASLIGFLKLPRKLKSNLNKILKEGIESRVLIHQQEEVKKTYQKYFPGIKL